MLTRLIATVAALLLACASPQAQAHVRAPERVSVSFADLAREAALEKALPDKSETKPKTALPARATLENPAPGKNSALTHWHACKNWSPLPECASGSADPWEGDVNNPVSLNPYLYGFGNPGTFVDPDGRQSADAGYEAIEALNPTPEERAKFHERVGRGQVGAHKALVGFARDSAIALGIMAAEGLASMVEEKTGGFVNFGANERAAAMRQKVAEFVTNDPVGEAKQYAEKRAAHVAQLSASGDIEGAAEASTRLGIDTASLASGAYGLVRGAATGLARIYTKLAKPGAVLTESSNGGIRFDTDAEAGRPFSTFTDNSEGINSFAEGFKDLPGPRAVKRWKSGVVSEGIDPEVLPEIIHQGSLMRGGNIWGESWKRYYAEVSGTRYPGQPFHAHHLAEKGGLSAEAASNREILVEVGLDPNLSRENMTWAPNNVSGQHGTTPQGELNSQLSQVRGNRDGVIEVLRRWAIVSEERK